MLLQSLQSETLPQKEKRKRETEEREKKEGERKGKANDMVQQIKVSAMQVRGPEFNPWVPRSLKPMTERENESLKVVL